MAADSPAEKLLIKLLLQNKLITKSQLKRTIEQCVEDRSKITLPNAILEKMLVDPKVLDKVLSVIKKKKVSFPTLDKYSPESSE